MVQGHIYAFGPHFLSETLVFTFYHALWSHNTDLQQQNTTQNAQDEYKALFIHSF